MVLLWYNPHHKERGEPHTPDLENQKKEVMPINSDRIKDLCRGNNLKEMAEAYIESCRDHSGSAGKARDRLPNLAGFCREFSLTGDELLHLKKEKPELYEYLMFTFEDELLNFGSSPTLLAAYLKKRLGYGDHDDSAHVAAEGEMRLIFEHNIDEDGI